MHRRKIWKEMDQNCLNDDLNYSIINYFNFYPSNFLHYLKFLEGACINIYQSDYEI